MLKCWFTMQGNSFHQSKRRLFGSICLILFVSIFGGLLVIPGRAAQNCTSTLNPGADVSSAIGAASSGSTLCLKGGNYTGFRIDASRTNKSSYVTVTSIEGETATFNGSITFDNAKFVRLQKLKIVGGLVFRPAGNNIEIIGNEITGDTGVTLFGDYRPPAESGNSSCPCKISDVLIEGNNIHDIDYSGAQGLGSGVGVGGFGDVYNVIVRGNTIKSTASDYIQSGMIHDWTVDGNTFLGPSLQFPNHPSDHQDLWQIFGCDTGCYDINHLIYNITYTNNIARNTGTAESLLFQTAYFQNVKIENNLFDKDSRGTTIQIYNTNGLSYKNNTHIEEGESSAAGQGAIFRDGGGLAGANYQITNNIFIKLRGSAVAIGTEGRAGSWGTYDFNVTNDGSAPGANSIKNWSPSWVDAIYYEPVGLPFVAGYRYNAQSGAKKGDLNGDGLVDYVDLSILLTNYGSQNPVNKESDINLDNIVDIFDLSILLSGYGK